MGPAPDRRSASWVLGVTIVALGRRSSTRSDIAPFSMSSCLLVDTITGSTTRGIHVGRPASTARIVAASASIPVLMAPIGNSSEIACIWSVMIPGSRTRIPLTSRVFWAVIAVTTERPHTPSDWKTLRSAWIPAPPPESDPAMVRAYATSPFSMCRHRGQGS